MMQSRQEQTVKNSFAKEREEEEAKRRRFAEIDEKMRRSLAELAQNNTVVQINPDKEANSQAGDALVLIEKVARFLEGGHYTSAEMLCKHLYRIVTIPAAREAIRSARKLCHAAVIAENKWVRRRATLLRRKEGSGTIRAERKKYKFDPRLEVADLLATATLEVSEGISKRGGEFYGELQSRYEVILPNQMAQGEEMVLANAPIMFNSVRYLDEREFNKAVKASHGFNPELRRVERGFFVVRKAAVVGVAAPLRPESGTGRQKDIKAEKKIRALEKALEAKLNRAVSVSDFGMVHQNSRLFWYAYDFPVEVESMHFADAKIVEDYGTANTPLLIDGQMTRDEFVKRREDIRLTAMRQKSAKQREDRQRFELDHMPMINQVKEIQDVIEEMNEKIEAVSHEFKLLTATVVNVDSDGIVITNGLPISRYRSIGFRFAQMYFELAPANAEQRDKLWQDLQRDKLQARETYYEYRDMSRMRTSMNDHLKFLQGELVAQRDAARASGKAFLSRVEAAATEQPGA